MDDDLATANCLAALKAWCANTTQACDSAVALKGCGPAAYLICTYPDGKNSAIADLKNNHDQTDESTSVSAVRQLCDRKDLKGASS